MGLRETTERKNFYVPVSILRRAERVAAAKHLNFSQLMRLALEEYIDSLEKEKIRMEIAEGCRAYARRDKETSAEWSSADTDPWE